MPVVLSTLMWVHFEKDSMLLNFIRIAVEKRVVIKVIRAMQAKPTRKLISLVPKPVKSFGIFVLRVSALCPDGIFGFERGPGAGSLDRR